MLRGPSTSARLNGGLRDIQLNGGLRDIQKKRGRTRKPDPYLVCGGCAGYRSDPLLSAYGQTRKSRNPLQVPFSCTPDTLSEMEGAISAARLTRYMPPANHDKPYAMRLYLWNAALCESLYLPLQTAEVCVRNAIHGTLIRRYDDWVSNHAFINLLQPKYQDEVANTAAKQKLARGASYSIDHVVAAMSFGFWANLLANSYEHHLWQQGMRRSFPHAPTSLTRERAYLRVNQLRIFRNKIAHHYAIFDKQPLDENQNALEIVGWSSPATQYVVRQLSNPREVARKPRRWP